MDVKRGRAPDLVRVLWSRDWREQNFHSECFKPDYSVKVQVLAS